MLQLQVGREATERRGSPLRTHRPARTILYQLVEEYSHVLEAQWTAEGRVMPGCFWREFEDYLKSGRLGLACSLNARPVGKLAGEETMTYRRTQ